MFDMPCRSCGAHDVEMFLDLGGQPHCNRLLKPGDVNAPNYPLRVGFCHRCTLVQIDHTIPREDMFLDYPYVSGTTRTLRKHFADSTKRLQEMYQITRDDLVVDIGCNDGTWLDQWECRTVGVEPCKDLAYRANCRDGTTIYAEFFDANGAEIIRHRHGPAKLITAAGVFFHLENLHDAVRGCVHLLDDEGVLVIQAIYIGDVLANNAFDQFYHEHLCMYSLASLHGLLQQHGMKVFHVEHLPVHGGTMEYHISTSRQETDAALLLALDEERNGLTTFGAYKKFGAKAWSLMRDMQAELYRHKGKKVWAYGAPAKGATLLHSAGITRDLVQCAVEKNPLKVGKEIPGCRIPIVAEGDERPDVYLLLAWNFADEIFEKEKAFLESGGQFIVPFPNVHVVGG